MVPPPTLKEIIALLSVGGAPQSGLSALKKVGGAPQNDAVVP